ncbi:hypothetical protein IWQ60_005023 [Tieghemiomyces parasiticus]|uniref:Uncharacterized protein n=1 Tax=Tieghemiomyces parasiticus TaxID=78921 RepID=A0A9W8AD60_9FUNG|nr:hypothetical protein IWQ60_005023 [Tieghemiomyces parasiticus]
MNEVDNSRESLVQGLAKLRPGTTASLSVQAIPPPTVVPKDLIGTPYSNIYKLSTKLNDDELGLLLRRFLDKPCRNEIIAKYVSDEGKLFDLTNPEYLMGPRFNKEDSPFWARDLTVALVTLRFFRDRTAINPKSELYKTLDNKNLVPWPVQAHIWAIGTELGVPGVKQFLPIGSGNIHAIISDCVRERNWQHAMEALKQPEYEKLRTHEDYEPMPCLEYFYTASPIRLGPNQSLIVQTVRIEKK